MSKFWKVFTVLIIGVAFNVLVQFMIPTKFSLLDYLILVLIGVWAGYMLMIGIDFLVEILKKPEQ